MSLVCYRRTFSELLNHDSLLVMGKGLGLHTIVAKFLKIYCGTGKLVLVLNADGREQLLVDTLRADGVPPSQLPVVVDCDMDGADRKARYLAGGVFLVTARILVPDLLCGRVPCAAAAGFVVCGAQQVNETSSLAHFALRIWRDGGGTGFVKAFSDEPEALVSGFGRLEKTMRALFVSHVSVWPRFHVLLARELAAAAASVAVSEYSQPLTPAMQTIQRCLLECMDACLAELRRATTIDVDQLTLENGLFERFDELVRRQLESTWDTVRPRTKRVIEDMRVLRKLLHFLLRYDAVAFHAFLDVLRLASMPAAGAAARQAQENEWLRSDAGIKLWRASLARLYTCVENPSRRQQAADAAAAGEAVEDDAALLEAVTSGPIEVVERLVGEGPHGPPPAGAAASAVTGDPDGRTRRFRLQIVLEHSPKWALLEGIMREIATQVEEGEEGSGAAVLIVARDERACMHLREVLAAGPGGGPGAMLRASFGAMLRKLAARSRRMRAAVLGSARLARTPRADAARLARLQQLLPRDEYELLLASEIPGWPTAAAAAEQQGEAVAAVDHPRLRAPALPPLLQEAGVAAKAMPSSFEGDDEALLAQALADLQEMPAPGDGEASNAAAAAAVDPDGGTNTKPREPAAPRVHAIAAAAVSRPPAAAAAAAPSRTALSSPSRPAVLPEQRLLWRACAQSMLRERQEVLRQHAALLAQCARAQGAAGAAVGSGAESMSRAEQEATEAGEPGPAAAANANALSGAAGDEPPDHVGGLILQSQFAEACQLSLAELQASQAHLVAQLVRSSRPPPHMLLAAMPTSAHEEGEGDDGDKELPPPPPDARRAAGIGAAEAGDADAALCDDLLLLPAAGAVDYAPAAAGADASASDQPLSHGQGPLSQVRASAAAPGRATTALRQLAPAMRDMLTEALGRRQARTAADAIAGRALTCDAAAAVGQGDDEKRFVDQGGDDERSGKKRSAAGATLSAAAVAQPRGGGTSGSGNKQRRLLPGSASGAYRDGDDDPDFVVVDDDAEEETGGSGSGMDASAVSEVVSAGTQHHQQQPTIALKTNDDQAQERRRAAAGGRGGGGGGRPREGMFGLRERALLSAYRGVSASLRPLPPPPPRRSAAAAAAAATGSCCEPAHTAAAAAAPAAAIGVRARLLPRGAQVVVFPLSRLDDRMPLLADLRPSHVVLYDPDPAFARELEVHAAASAPAPVRAGQQPQPRRLLRVHFCMYEASAEKQRYLSALRLEQAAFERIIAEKATMAPPPLTASAAGGGAAAPGPSLPARKGLVDGWGITNNDGPGSGSSGGAAASTAARRQLTVDIACPDRGRRIVCVDIREFRAKLPMALYKAGLELAQGTLTVGDFILSPDMCVERKSVPDLFGSFASGRLFAQATAMARHYRWPVLCIEFEEAKPFSLQPNEDAIRPHEVDPANAVSKLVLLTLHIPTLRILWSRSATASATLFAALKQSEPEPDLAAAVRVGAEEAAAAVEGATAGVAAGGGGSATGGAAPSTAGTTNIAGMELLRKLPGVHGGNCGLLARRAGSLAQLAALSEAELAPILGAGSASALYTFLHARNAASL